MPNKKITRQVLPLIRYCFFGFSLLALLTVHPIARAVPLINSATQFTPADTARDPDSVPNNGDEYMDSAGVWNGLVEVTNTTGDSFQITLTNSAAGAPDPLVDDVAFDIGLTLNVPAGFRLPVSPFNVTTAATGGDPGAANCVAPGGGTITATQAGGAGTPITFNIPADTNLPARAPCNYSFQFGLTTNDSAPFVTGGNYQLDYDFSYNEIDDDAGSQQTTNAMQSVEVREGDIIIVKAAVPNPADPNGAYADGETAEWTVSVFGNGNGGSFAVLITDLLNINFDAATLQLTPPANPPGTPFPVPVGNNQYTINYLAPGQRVDITVQANVAVPANAASCPDLRNDVNAADRLGNASASFDSVVFDLQDPLLAYTPNDINIPFGGTDTVSFNVTNPGLGADGGTARNIVLDVSGLAGFTVSNVSALWAFDGTSQFTYLGLDGLPASGDEILVNGGSALLQFDVGMGTCGGPAASTLTWTPSYENLCGLSFTPPIETSTITVVNEPTLGITKAVAPGVTNFGQPAVYTIDITGANAGGLPTVAGVDNDWTVTDTLPPGVSAGVIPAVPTGTIITIGATVFTDVDTNIPVTAGDTIIWQGDRDDLVPTLPSITVNFTVDSGPFCPPDPPITIGNTATLDYPSCGINVADGAALLVNDSPIDGALQQFTISAGTPAPFETGRPDTDLVAVNEANEGERITFTATYQFPVGYPGIWSGSSLTTEMGTGAGGLAGSPLQLAFVDGNGDDLPTAGEVSGVTVQVTNPGGPDFPLTNLTIGAAAGQVTVNPGGTITIANLDFIGAVVGANMADTTFTIAYTVTAPEGNLDANLQPLDEVNIGAFTERLTFSVANNPASCGGGIDFTQGITGIQLERSDVGIGGNISTTNDAGACGPTTATIDITAPPAGGLNADNIRILLQGTDYVLPNMVGDYTFGGAGNLAALNPTISFAGSDVIIEVTPGDGGNLTGDSTISFPVNLNAAAAARDLPATVFFDSNHTSPDFSIALESDEDYNNAAVLAGPVQTANLDVEFFPPNVILGDPNNFADVDPGQPGLEGVFTWLVRITNVGTNTVSGYVFSNMVPPGFLPFRAGSSPVADAGLLTDPLMVWSGLPDLLPGGSVEITVAIGLPQNAGCNVGNPNQTTVASGCVDGTTLFTENGPNVLFPVIDLQLEHLDTSFCELCRDGTVELEVRNEGASDLYDVVVTENLAGSGLEYVLGSTEVFVEGTAGFVAVGDNAATNATQIVWDSTNIAALGQLLSEINGMPSEMTIRFRVRSSDPNAENLVAANRNISASGDFNLFCGDPGLPLVVDNFQVPLRQPQPQVEKLGRNFSARQTAADYADPVFGGTDDIVIWQVDVANSGVTSSADLEDLLVNDTVAPGLNFTLQFVCPTEADADARAVALETLVAPADACIPYLPVLDVDDPFGNPGNDQPGTFIDAAAGSSAFVYYVGTIQNLCTNENNNVDIQWGCESNSPPAGGINADGSGGALSAGLAAGDDDDSAFLSTTVDPNGVLVTQTFTGTNTAQPVGTKGILTITVTNNSGGTVRDLILTDTLPTDYELDLTSLNPPNTPFVVNPAFGVYPGIADTFAVNATNPNQPVFTFTSSTQGTVNQANLLRNGDELVLTVGVVRVRPFDNVNDPEVRTENPGDGTDPDYAPPLPADDDNTVSLQFSNTCGTVFTDADSVNLPSVIDVNINPEDIDVDINPADPNLLFILSDPTATLNFNVVVSNNGGHDASDYDTYVTVGNGIDPGVIPAGCALAAPPAELGFPPTNPAGILPPEYNPADSLTFRCVTTDPIPPGGSDTFGFTIQRALPLGVSGDLTFRADVLARTTLSDGSAPPDRGAAGYPYYSKDNILARIIGFNLFKTFFGNCSEDNPPPVANGNVIIGEECTFEVEAEWFGFATPGFGNIEVRNPRIYEGALTNNPPPPEGNPGVDPPNLPDTLDGQGLVSIDTTASSAGVSVAVQNPAAPAALAETGLAWRLNNIAAVGNTEERFIARVRWRTLNDPVNTSAVPNLHAALQNDEVNARFDVFFSGTGATVSFDETTAGYPPAALRIASVVVTEPNVTITKEVCNESISIANNPADSGANCQPFVALPGLVMGDSDDLFIYRLTVNNEAAASGVPRAPAYDVAINDSFDASDQIAPFDFTTDGLDNDGDGLVDAADLDGEGTVDDLVLVNGNPADITIDSANSTALAQVDPGATVELFYRARLDNMVTPTQQLINTADGTYDSLPGASGSQSAPLGASGALGGARQYNIPQAQATIEIDNIVVNPGSKEFIDSARRDAGLVAGVCASPCVDENVVIGEEVMVELEFTLPLSELRQFALEDNLPAGIECIEAMDIVLPVFNPPAVDPGFTPGGVFPAATCDANLVRWDLSLAGDQTLQGTGGTMQFDVQARFIARVQNTVVTNNGGIIANGGASTNVNVSYRDAGNTLVMIPIDEARLTVQEPVVTVTKTMDPVAPAITVDARDLINVTVQVQNNGTSPAYNLRLQDDLTAPGTNLTYIAGSQGGANIPDVIDLTIPNAPVFIFNNPLPPAGTFTFTFQVRAADIVQPLEELNNTVAARFTSLPNNNVALNAGGAIGLDGAPNGMRTGAIPPAGDPVNDYEAQGVDQEIVPPLTIVKNDLTPGVPTTIGVRKNFEVVLTLPEGVSNGVIVNDNLMAGTTSFVLENNAAFDIVYTFQDIVSINGVPVAGFATPADAEAAMAAFTAVDAATGLVIWNFGNVVTAIEQDPLTTVVNPRIVINYFARVGNNVTTVAGATLQNAADSNYINGENGGVEVINAPLLGPFVVVEPDLVVNKTGPAVMNPAVPASFTITADNIGTSTAWDVTITDLLPNLDPAPGGMCDNAPVITAIDVAGRALVENVDYTLTFNPAPACTFLITLIPTDAAPPANNARIDAGETLTVVYDHVLDADTASATNLTNIAGATQWFSLDTDGVLVPPEIRTYNRVLTNGTVGVPDHEDAHTLLAQGPVLSISKLVTNLTTGQGPAVNVSASPGDDLQFTLQVDNTGPVAGNNVRVFDDPDLLNTPPGYYENFSTDPTERLRNVTISAPATDNSLVGGGVNNSGFLDITLNTLDACPAPPACPPGSSATVTFDITLDQEILNTAVLDNRASTSVLGLLPVNSNLVQVQVGQTPGLIVEKTSQDLTGDPNVLAVGDQLRYTITAKNISNENAVNVLLRDQIPANTTYVANSTFLNGFAVADPAANTSALTDGLLINSVDVAVPGFMTANPDPAVNNVATIQFTVTVNSNLVNGTVISNQGVVTGLGENNGLGFVPILSDDPATPVANDPTQDIVGSGPIIDAQKQVSIVAGGADGTADPGDTLRYTITVFNSGNSPATGVRLRDAVPASTTYAADTVSLNGLPVAQPDGGISPLIAGIDISSSDLTPPLPGAGAGTLSAGGVATIVFDVTINGGTAAGTIISNQGFITSNQLPEEPTDQDGNDENGDQPTEIVVGGIPELEITKEVVIVGGGTAQAGGQLEYLIRVENTGPVAADNIVISDTMPALTTYVNGSGRINGAVAGVTFAGNVLTADYTSVFGTLGPGDFFLVTFRVQIDALGNPGQSIDNTANLVWNDGAPPNFNAADSASVDIGGAPGVVNLNGLIWHDANHNDLFDPLLEQSLQGWEVQVYFNNAAPTSADTPIATAPLTSDSGLFSFNGLSPGGPYTVTFALPANNVALGETVSTAGTAGLMIITDIFGSAGNNLQDENLAVEPTGVVYNSVSRTGVGGARVRLVRPDGSPVPAGCFITPAHLTNQQGNSPELLGQVTPGFQTSASGQEVPAQAGFYRFDLNFTDPVNCPIGLSDYQIQVIVPNEDDFVAGVSGVIPPDTGPVNLNTCTAPAGQSVDTIPPPPASTCDIQAQGLPPDPVIPRGNGTRYFLDLQLGQTSQSLFNNHIPLDPVLDGVVAIAKTTPLKNVVKGQLVPYTITLTNSFTFPLTGLFVLDNFPAGFKYVEGSAQINGVSTEPVVDGLTLTWSDLTLQGLDTMTIKLLLIVGAGVGEGEYTNTAQAFIAGLAGSVSGVASATVRVVPDPTFDCSDVVGKVYDDRNANGYPDSGEPGIPGARVVTARGLVITADQFGRFHVVCAAVPNPDRGSNFIIKLDERSLPSGYRVTTENPRVQRLTRGKAAKFNFGVTVHRVVRVDLTDAAFEPGGAEIREHWHYVIDDLFKQLREGPSVLRLSYLGDRESGSLAARRVKATKKLIAKRWKALSCCYNLQIETEVFWRTGRPGDK